MEIYEDLESEEYFDFDDDGPTKSAKVPRISGSVLYKPPTADELNSLRDTEALFHSNLIKLQVTELLKEVTLSEKKRTKVDEFLHSLHDVISSLPSLDKFRLSAYSKEFSGVEVPFVMKPATVKGMMVCAAPADIKVVGSYLLHTGLKQDMNIDIVLELPEHCMQAKDFLNQRYLRKRAIYLMYVAQNLKNHELISDTKFKYFDENPLKPVLLVKPEGKLSDVLTVHIHTSPGQDHFKPERFLPSKGNVRKTWFTGISEREGDDILRPTPSYNSLVLQDMLMVENLKYLYEALADFEGIRDGIKLLKVWLRQREFDQGSGSFSGFLISVVASYLMKIGKINKTMSSYQVVRIVFQYLSTTDWTVKGVSMCGGNVEEFQKHFEVVFVDPSGALNLCSSMPAAMYKQVCKEAEYSLKTLDNKSIKNGFDSVFMMPVPFVRKFDHILQIVKPWSLQKSCEKLNLTDSLPDFGGNAITCSLPQISMHLHRALGSRVSLIGYRGCRYGPWDVNTKPPAWRQPTSNVAFGFLLASDAFSVIDKGPGADTPEATSFRQFWGDKSELRRFQDGSICEAVVWTCKSKTEQRNVMERICRHVLRLHCNMAAGSMSYTSNQIEKILTLTTDVGQKKYVPVLGYVGTGDEMNLRLIHSYNDLCRQLRNLKDLPLTVVSLQGISPALRYTEVYPPTQITVSKDQVMKKVMKRIQVPDSVSASPPFVHAVEVICHLEGSGKWPQEIEALRRLKAAFHITFAEELEREHENLTCVPTQTYMDVHKDGFIFRVTIAYHREITIMQTFTTRDGLVKVRSTPQSVQLEEKTVHLPRLASALHGLHQAHPSFGRTCRLAKRWINGQLLSRQVPGIVIELLCAHLYLNPQPFTQPGSSQIGFLRFLWFLSTFDFQENPIILDLAEEFTESDITSIHKHFKSNRDTLPAVFIATSKDKTRSIWTRKQPVEMILRRMKALASISLKSFEVKVANFDKETDFKGIFAGSLSAYDVIIHLEPHCVARKYESCQSDVIDDDTEEELPPSDERPILPVVDFDPVKLYLDELQASFNEIAMFFHNTNGGLEIGVLWRPNAFQAKEFKVSTSSFMSVVKGSTKVAPDVNAIIENFQILGEGLIKNVELRTDKWNI